MTVRELRVRLAELPDDAIIAVDDGGDVVKPVSGLVTVFTERVPQVVLLEVKRHGLRGT